MATAVVASAGCESSAASDEQGSTKNLGSVNMSLVAGPGLIIQQVKYVVTDAGGSTVLDKSVDLTDPQATFQVRFSLKAGTGYKIQMTAQTTAGTACAGSATFDVIAAATQQVSVDLLCDGENAPGNTGDVVVNGTVTPGVTCPNVSFMTASPLQTSVGGTVALSGGASSTGAGVVSGWTASKGTIAAAGVGATTFTCTEPGAAVLTFSVTKAPSCTDSSTVQVNCVAASIDSGIPPAPDASAPPTPDASVPPTPDASVPPTPDASAPPAPDAGTPVDAGPQPPRQITLKFKAKVSGTDFACGQNYPGQGTAATTVSPTDFRFFVQSVRLLTAAGSEVPLQMADRAPWQNADVALVDFENGQGFCQYGNTDTNTIITGTVPAGDYTGVAFVNGIPDALDHGDPATAPAPIKNAPGTLWSWLSGYKFILAELGQVKADGTLGDGLGLTHVGSTGCTGSPQTGGTVTCAKPNKNSIRLTNFNPDTNTIVADLGTVFTQTDLTVDAECHSSGQYCATGFAVMGVDFATGQALATQQFYHVE